MAKLIITTKIVSDNGEEIVQTRSYESDVPEFDDFTGPETFWETFRELEEPAIELRNKSTEETLEAYVSELSKKKPKKQPKKKT